MPKVEKSRSITGIAEGRPDYSELMTGEEKIAFSQTVEGLMKSTGAFTTALTGVTIDTHKDWGGYRIVNLGAPLAAGHALRRGDESLIDHDSLGGLVAAEHLSLPNTIANVLSDHNLANHPTSIIPNLPASKITSGEFGADRIPSLPASKVTSGIFGIDRIPSPLQFKDVELQEAPASDHTGSGIYITDTVGEDVVVGDVLYMKSDGKWWKADADASTTMPGAGLAMEAKSANADCKILLYGFFRDDTWNYTVGKILYVVCTGGPPTETAPAGSGDQVQVVGVAITADIILFNPSYELVEIS